MKKILILTLSAILGAFLFSPLGAEGSALGATLFFGACFIPKTTGVLGAMNFEAENFNTFDAGSNYDAETYDTFDEYGQQTGKAIKKTAVATSHSNITIKVDNKTAAKLTVELFSFLFSVAKITNTYTSTSTFVPQGGVAFAQLANLNSTIGFSYAGDLVYQDAAGAKMTVSCSSSNYRALFEMAGNSNFICQQLKMNFTTDPQIDNEIVHFRKTALGIKKENRFVPRNYQSEYALNQKLITIKQPLPIDMEHGIYVDVEAGEILTFNIQLRRVERVTTLANN